MRKKTYILALTGISCLLIATAFTHYQQDTEPAFTSSDPKVSKLKLPAGFKADRLYGPSEHEEGSWVSMTFDPKGRIIASDQYGYLYRITVPAIGDTITKTRAEKLEVLSDSAFMNQKDPGKISMGYAQGLLYAFNSLYVMINHSGNNDLKRTSGLYRLQDTNGDDQYDKITLLKSMQGSGEHGTHSVVLSPDKQSIHVVAGNFTKIPKMDAYRNIPDGKLDNLFPLIKDPNGHDNTVESHGGWVAKTDPEGKKWELIASGLRNSFDIAFNDAGEMFTYDSDMEWDFGTPWYRPTRILHVTSGAEFGWRPGTLKWNANYPDNLPAVINVGQGSPTNFMSGSNAKFPTKYRNALFAFDWSFGIIYAVYPTPNGASYTATGEEFISGSPLPLTDGTIGPDGAMYFLTGGRRLESDLYRVYYTGSDVKESKTVAPVTDALKTRRKLELLHGVAKPGAVDEAWPFLKDQDRHIRYAARIAIEAQPITEWKDKTLQEKDPVILTQAAIALARRGDASVKKQLLSALTGANIKALPEPRQLDMIRAVELVFARMGAPDAADKLAVAAMLDPLFPAASHDLNKELSKMLVYVEAPGSVKKTMALLLSAKDDPKSQQTLSASSDLILRNPQYGMDIAGMLSKMPPLNQTWYANVLSQASKGWTDDLRNQYFNWYTKAFGYKGGVCYVGFIDKARKNALETVPKELFVKYNKMSGDSLVTLARKGLDIGPVRPKGPGKNWKVEEALQVVSQDASPRNFDQGKAMFAASLCRTCHQMKGEGGVAGPDLTQLGTRFSDKDMLEAIIAPNKTISDQYGSTVFYLKAGGSILGRLIRQDNEKYYISQNPFDPQTVREVQKKNVLRTRVSEISPMLPGMINALNAEELKDLMAYLKSGGNPNHAMFSAGNATTKSK
ncbi:MAG: c-type cytochrome [Chitinophagaceae bacterium]|nr:c-type cytochrome [Chitinophagaceae bacterium]